MKPSLAKKQTQEYKNATGEKLGSTERQKRYETTYAVDETCGADYELDDQEDAVDVEGNCSKRSEAVLLFILLLIVPFHVFNSTISNATTRQEIIEKSNKVFVPIATFWQWPAKSNHHLFAAPARNNDLTGEANGDGQWRQAERRAGHRNFSRNLDDGSSN